MVAQGPTLAVSSPGSAASPLFASGSVPHSLSAGLGNMSGALPPAGAPLVSQGSLRRRSKLEIADHFLANLRSRGMEVDPALTDELRSHFESLPSRWGAGQSSCMALACLPLLPALPARPISRSNRDRRQSGKRAAACPVASAALPRRRPEAKPPGFDQCSCRYALDVNISSLDVLNHKRLLDSARSDPSAVSFQLRPVDVVSGSDLAKRPSFGSLDTLQMHHEVRAGHTKQLQRLQQA